MPPQNLGSVKWPDAKAGVLDGLKFFITGVYETIEYEDIVSLIKDCGGGMMTVVSPKLTYLLVGRDAGPVKLQMAQKKNVQTIDEEGFFKYITNMIASDGASGSGPAGGGVVFSKPIAMANPNAKVESSSEDEVPVAKKPRKAALKKSPAKSIKGNGKAKSSNARAKSGAKGLRRSKRIQAILKR